MPAREQGEATALLQARWSQPVRAALPVASPDGQKTRTGAVETGVWLVAQDSAELVADQCTAAVEQGRGVLVVHPGAASGAVLQAGLDRQFSGTPLVVAVHAAAGDGDYLRVFDQLGRLTDHVVALVVPAAPVRCAELHGRLQHLNDGRTGLSVQCVVPGDALSPDAVLPLLRHHWIEGRWGRSTTGTCTDRLASVDSILGAASVTDCFDEISDRCYRLGLPASQVDRAVCRARVERALSREAAELCRHTEQLRHQLQAFEVQAGVRAAWTEAARAGNGDVVVTLRQAAAAAGHPILVEDEAGQPLFWSDEPGPPPTPLKEMLGPARWRSTVEAMTVGAPSVVRLGPPTAGARLVLRLSGRRPAGFVSLVGSPFDPGPTLVELILALEVPLLVACRSSQLNRSASELAVAGVMRILVADGYSTEERLDAADLLGWRPDLAYRAVVARQRAHPGVSGPGRLTSLRRSARQVGFVLVVVGDGLVGLLRHDDPRQAQLAEWAVRHELVVGTSEVTSGVGETPRAVRQAQWAAQIAAEEGMGAVRFDDLGVESLLFPDVRPAGCRATRVLVTLRQATGDLGFDPVATLQEVLGCGGNVAMAARRLRVHANTVRYRLERIAAVAGVDIGEHDIAFELELALRVERSRERLATIDGPVDRPHLQEERRHSCIRP
jgi:hypothetical protein